MTTEILDDFLKIRLKKCQTQEEKLGVLFFLCGT